MLDDIIDSDESDLEDGDLEGDINEDSTNRE